MGILGWIRRRFEVLLRKSSVEAELDDEIRFHVEMEIRERVASGMSPEAARRQALIAFGGVERTKEQVRDARGGRVLDDWWLDTRVAVRSFAREPAFLVAVLATLGLGIGGNVAMLGILDASLLQGLPYPESERLVMGRVTYEGNVGNTVSAPDFLDYREQASGLEALGAFTPFELQATVTGNGDAERVVAPIASHDIFVALRTRPLLGRLFVAEDGEPGAEPVVVLSHAYWQQRFGSDPNVVGGTITVDGTPTTIAGVLPDSFRFPVRGQIWRPFVRNGPFAGARQFHNWVLIGRLESSTTLEAAQAEVNTISTRLAELYPDSNRDKGLRLTPLREAISESYRSTLLMLGGAIVLLLLIACSNVGGLLLARVSARGSELAVRTSLGAGRGRLLRQFLAEGAVLVLLAGIVGLTIAHQLQQGMVAFLGNDGITGVTARLSAPAVAVALGAASLTVAAFGAAPAAWSAGHVGASQLRQRRGSGDRATARFRQTLVIAQVTMTVVLLMTSGLLVRSLSHLYRVEAGFEVERLITAEIHLPAGAYADVRSRPTFYERFQDQVSEIPGVLSVGLVNRLPLRDRGGDVRVAPPAEWGQSGVFGRLAYQRMVLPGYFETMGIPLLAGRDFERGDTRDRPPVIVVSAALAVELFGTEPAVGRELGVDVGEREPWVAEVVGVVGDVTTSSLAEGQEVTMYFAYGQRSPASMRLAVRTSNTAPHLPAALREVVASLDPDVPVSDIASMEDVLSGSVSDRRAVLTLLSTFAAAALLLAAMGIYGVLSYEVARQRHEIGVRMALGSSTGGVVRSVMRSGLILVGIGLLLGLPASLLAGRLVRGLLFGVGPVDPLPYLATVVFLGGVGVIASTLPARRAARVDPVVAFRAD